MTLRAEEAEFLLKDMIADEQRRLQTILAPHFAALCDIEARKPPRPVVMDGRMFTYVGPTAEDMTGRPYSAPDWLENLCRDDVRFAQRLEYFRRKIA